MGRFSRKSYQSLLDRATETFKEISAYLRGKKEAIDNLEVICVKCWKDRPATHKRCKCGGLYVVIKEEANVESRS